MPIKKACVSTAAVVVLGAGLLATGAPASSAETSASPVDEGKAIAFDRSKGNCLACHMIAGGEVPGDIGPPLVAIKARYPDKAKLRAQIWDATVANPHSVMPPFGRNQILTEQEMDKVVEYIYTL